METGFAIVPSVQDSEGFVELARSKQGRVFEKHILNYGPLLYPAVKGGKVNIDDTFADKLIKNFNAKVCDIVQVPLAGAQNEHTEDPTRNIGEVIGLVKRNRKIYARIDARDEVHAERLGKTLLGASAMLHLNYTDTRTLQKVGPTLLHVCVTNRPYVVGLDDFEELVAASAQGPGAVDGMSDAVVLTAPTREDPMTLEEMLAELKADHGIDVPALQEKAATVDSAVALTGAVQTALTEQNLLVLSADSAEPTADDMVTAIVKAGEQIVTLTKEIEDTKTEQRTKDAQAHVKELIRTGHILPKSEEAQVQLLLTNPDLFDQLLPEQPLVALSNEEGSDPPDEKPAEDVDAEVTRLTSSPAAAPYVHPKA